MILTDPVDGYQVDYRTRADLRLVDATYVNGLSNVSNGLFGHHAVTNPSPIDATWRAIQSFHMRGHGWSDIGYSFGYGFEGDMPVIVEGRGWDRAGGHTRGFNHSSLGFCYIGNSDVEFPEAARRAFVTLVRWAEQRFGAVGVRGHIDVNATACPGGMKYEWLQMGRPLAGLVAVPTPVPAPLELVDNFDHFKPSETRALVARKISGRWAHHGDDVAEWQFCGRFVAAHYGLEMPDLDGVYGSQSERVCFGVQATYNDQFAPAGGAIDEDGIAGEQTRHALVVLLNASGVWGSQAAA